jgi:hypothetical protein
MARKEGQSQEQDTQEQGDGSDEEDNREILHKSLLLQVV